jgi:hypothetical protein
MATPIRCINLENQLIYIALLDKAASYPPEDKYNAKAYRKAAESIANYKPNIFDMFDMDDDSSFPSYQSIPSVGFNISEFISDYVTAVYNGFEIRYDQDTTKHDKKDEDQDDYEEGELEDDDNDSRYDTLEFYDVEEVIGFIKAVCIKVGFEYSPKLLNEFNIWFGPLNAQWPGRNIKTQVDYWANEISPTLIKHHNKELIPDLSINDKDTLDKIKEIVPFEPHIIREAIIDYCCNKCICCGGDMFLDTMVQQYYEWAFHNYVKCPNKLPYDSVKNWGKYIRAPRYKIYDRK